MSRKLSEPILDNPSGGGNFFSNFFNGRVLTADALNADQAAHRQQRRLVGRAVGDGVVEGLEVKIVNAGGVGAQAVVSLSKGLALNRAGQVLQLHSDEQVALVRQFDAPPAVAGDFEDCAVAVSTFDTLENGAYLLVIGPASGYRERVPMRGLSDAAGVNECGSRYRVEGVQFRLARFNPALMNVLSAATQSQISALMSSTEPADLSKLRNLLAHVCFGTEELAAIPRDPLKQSLGQSAYVSYGAADFLRGRAELNDCEVPLALLFWRGATLRFADMWAVRRRVRARAGGQFAQLFAPRRVSEAEAMLFQFEEHLRSLVAADPNPDLIVAANFFRWLPPAGIVPLRNAAHPQGTTYEKFFLNKSFGPPNVMAGAQLRALLGESLDYPPVDLAGQELVQLYTVRENTQAQTGEAPPQPFVVYTSQEMSYYSDQPRFAALCQTLRGTRDAYRNLIQKNVFLANASSPEALTPRLSVTAALQAVSSAASERHVSACRCNCILTREKALTLMQDLYDVQKSLHSVLNAEWSTAINTVGMKGFASLLKTALDVAVPGGKLSLKASIEAQDLSGALAAQNYINGLGVSWAGEAVTGNLEVGYLPPSSRGKTLVNPPAGGPAPAPPYLYTFRVTNKTNKALVIDVNAKFDGNLTAWDANTTIQTGSTINLLPFNASNPDNPAAFADVVVKVVPPGAAAAPVGTTATLRLAASVAPPVNVYDDDTVELIIGTVDVPEAATSVAILEGQDANGLDLIEIDGVPPAAPIGEPVTYGITSVYNTTTGPTPRNFRFFVVFNSPANANDLYQVVFNNKATETDTSLSNTMQKATLPYSVVKGTPDKVVFSIFPKSTAAVGNPLSFKVRIRAVDDATLTDDSQNFTITASNT